ncbi:MAG: helix-turn-helix transcriptional regulator [Bacillaceae bacterium]|nr:helix-turn-helix transcriptional regulator [Bacillaceae bacterium]
MKIGENIKFLRERENWYQRELADRLNISRSTLAKYETGERVPDLHTLIKMADIFDISLDNLVGRPYQMENILREVQKLYQSEEEVDQEMMEMIAWIQRNRKLKDVLKELSRKPRDEQNRLISALEVLLK